MQLRSGKSLTGVPSVKRSIATNDQSEFHNFCYDLLHKCDGEDKMTRRVYLLVMVESFRQCGPDFLKMYYPVMKVMYYKLKDAHAVAGEATPPDMKVYISQFLDLMIRVAPVGEISNLMYEKRISR